LERIATVFIVRITRSVHVWFRRLVRTDYFYFRRIVNSKIQVTERKNNWESCRQEWLGGRDSNPDSQIQSLESYHWTTSQQRSRIYGTRCGKSTFVCVRTTSNYWTDKKIMVALLAGSKDNTRAPRHPLALRFFRLV